MRCPSPRPALPKQPSLMPTDFCRLSSMRSRRRQLLVMGAAGPRAMARMAAMEAEAARPRSIDAEHPRYLRNAGRPGAASPSRTLALVLARRGSVRGVRANAPHRPRRTGRGQCPARPAGRDQPRTAPCGARRRARRARRNRDRHRTDAARQAARSGRRNFRSRSLGETMQTRIHKVLLGGLKSANHFGALTDDKGKPLDLNATAQAVNPRWPPYTDVCAETWELYPHEGADGKHQVWVLRANVRCSCAGPCHYHADHGGDAYAATPSAPAPTAQPARTKHGAALGHAEAMLVGAELSALAAQAKAVAGDPAARAKLAALLVADAKALDLSAAELEGE